MDQGFLEWPVLGQEKGSAEQGCDEGGSSALRREDLFVRLHIYSETDQSCEQELQCVRAESSAPALIISL